MQSLLHCSSWCAPCRACEGAGIGRQWLTAGSEQFSRQKSVCSPLFHCAYREQKCLAHKFAAPECPNLLKLRSAIEQSFQPICFYVKNDCAMGHHVYDQHFYGILCSPLFEGKTYAQINAMVDRVLDPIGLKGRVKLHCQPPSRFEKMRHRVRWRWQLEK